MQSRLLSSELEIWEIRFPWGQLWTRATCDQMPEFKLPGNPTSSSQPQRRKSESGVLCITPQSKAGFSTWSSLVL